jgi:outer membrane protein OmpA-like peptidoglycan-associated protein
MNKTALSISALCILSMTGCSTMNRSDSGYYVSSDQARESGGIDNYMDRSRVGLTRNKSANDGYFVSSREAMERNGVDNYIDRSQLKQMKEATASEEKPIMTSKAAPSTESPFLSLNSDLLFDYDSADLKPDASKQLSDLGKSLATDSSRKIRIEGFADASGSQPYNVQLSKRRADAVKSALVNAGADSNQITTYGYGEAKPLATNQTEQGRALNRRAEVHFLASDQTG